MELKKGEVFLYKEKEYPYLMSITQRIFENSIYPWNFYALGLKEGKISAEKFDLENLDILKKLFSQEKNEKLVLFTNSSYRCSYDTDGAHSDLWKHVQKGLNSREILNIEDVLVRRNFNFLGIEDRGFSAEKIFRCGLI